MTRTYDRPVVLLEGHTSHLLYSGYPYWLTLHSKYVFYKEILSGVNQSGYAAGVRMAYVARAEKMVNIYKG